MANVSTTYKNADSFGRASFEALDTYLQQTLLAGSEPALQPAQSILAGDSLTLAQFTVVGLNSSGKVVAATYNATEGSAIKAIGVLAHGFTSGASNATVFAQVWRFGCFNIDADSPLIWDGTFDTEAKKLQWHLANPNLVFRNRKAS